MKLDQNLKIVGLISLGLLLFAGEFRSIRPIFGPQESFKTPKGLKIVPQPISHKIARKAIEKITRAWNRNHLSEVLSDSFYDKSRLLDSIDEKVPRDAKLRILAIEGVQTLNQTIKPDPTKLGLALVVSEVSIMARTQIEYNDPSSGFQRLEGTNEFILKIKQRVYQ